MEKLMILVLIVSVSKTNGDASTIQRQYSAGYAQSYVEGFSQAFAASFGGRLTGLVKKLPDISRTYQYNQQDEPDVAVFVVEYQDLPKEPHRRGPALHRGQQFQGHPELHQGQQPQGHLFPYQGQQPRQPQGHPPAPYHGHRPDGHLPPTYHRQQTYGQSILQQVQQPYGHPPPAQQGPHWHKYIPPPHPPRAWAPVSQGGRYTNAGQVGYEHANLIQTQRDEERGKQDKNNPNFANYTGYNNNGANEQDGTSQDTYNYNNQMYYDNNAYYQNNLGRPTHGIGILEGRDGPAASHNQFNQNPKPSNPGAANHNQLSNNEGIILNTNSSDKNLSNQPLPLSTKPTPSTLAEGELSTESYGDEIPDFVPLYPMGNKQHETLKPEQEEEDFKIDIRFGGP